MQEAGYFKENRNQIIIFGLILLVFLAFRLPGIDSPYHQDEFKLAAALNRGGPEMWQYLFNHPPLEGIFLYTDNLLFGNLNLRVLPFLFSLISLVLLFVLIKNRNGIRSAYFAILFFAISFYSVWSSLMLDVDGAVLPLFFILSVLLYDKWQNSQDKSKWIWFALLLLSLITGFLVKLSFVLVLGVLLFDFIFENWHKISKKQIVYTGIIVVSFFVLFGAAIIALWKLYPNLQVLNVFKHALSYFKASSRNWIQIAVQAMKALFYLSPLLIAPLIFIKKETFKKTRIFSIYLILGLIFYFVLFDFSRAALDKYLMFLVVPLSVICGVIFAEILDFDFKSNKKQVWIGILFGLAIGVIIFTLNFLTHSVIPLYPKTEWFERALHFKWNMLNPFNGGSGPLGFYVSFLFIITSFITSLILAVIGIMKKNWRVSVMITILIIGLGYNLVFAEEFAYGNINGNAPRVLRRATAFIRNSPEIKKVMTYNDTGGYELSGMGKYGGRIYATPESESGYAKKFADYTKEGNGYFLIVNIPPLNPASFYAKYFLECQTVFDAQSGKITAKVYSCGRHAGEGIN